jgi:hypothetical protein
LIDRRPLLEFDPPPRLHPTSGLAVRRPRAPLLGFAAPSAHEEERIHVPTGPIGSPARHPPTREGRGIAPPVPKPTATVSLAGFLNPSATCSSLRRPAIFRRVALLGLHPSGARASHEDPPARHRWPALLTFLPRFARSCSRSLLHGRAVRCLGLRLSAFSGLQGLRPRVNRSAQAIPLSIARRPSPPGFSPPHGLHAGSCAGLAPDDRHASRSTEPFPARLSAALHGATAPRAAPLPGSLDLAIFDPSRAACRLEVPRLPTGRPVAR